MDFLLNSLMFDVPQTPDRSPNVQGWAPLQNNEKSLLFAVTKVDRNSVDFSDRKMDLQFARRTSKKRARTALTAKNRFFQIGPQFRRAPLRTNSSTARRDLALQKVKFAI